MKLTNKILEAVNRGILLALDDFDDEELGLHIKSKQVLNRDYTKEYLDLMKEVVDLGLPSGTLWCKYNLGVDLNLLSKAEDWYGDYYAWGELEPNKTNEAGEIHFYYNNYKFRKGSFDNIITKYNKHDNLIKLLDEDDAAYQFKKCHNFKFHMPTKELCEELLKYTSNYWVNNYDPNKIKHNPEDDGGIFGLNGRIFVGKNKNLLFIPAAGKGDGCSIWFRHGCNLWTSSIYLEYPEFVYYMYFESSNIRMKECLRYFGFSIRPVINL